MKRCLDLTVVEGIKTNIPLHKRILDDPDFVAGPDRHELHESLPAGEEGGPRGLMTAEPSGKRRSARGGASEQAAPCSSLLAAVSLLADPGAALPRPHLLLPRLQRHLLPPPALRRPGAAGGPLARLEPATSSRAPSPCPTFTSSTCSTSCDPTPPPSPSCSPSSFPIAALCAFALARDLGPRPRGGLRGRVRCSPWAASPSLP